MCHNLNRPPRRAVVVWRLGNCLAHMATPTLSYGQKAHRIRQLQRFVGKYTKKLFNLNLEGFLDEAILLDMLLVGYVNKHLNRHSERSEESRSLVSAKSWILRYAQNDEVWDIFLLSKQ